MFAILTASCSSITASDVLSAIGGLLVILVVGVLICATLFTEVGMGILLVILAGATGMMCLDAAGDYFFHDGGTQALCAQAETYCPQCGEKLGNDDKFCTSCGAQVELEDSSGIKSKKDADKKPASYCSKCGDELSEGDKFCPSCGAEVTSAHDEESHVDD